MKLFVVGVNYQTTPVELREQLAVSAAALACQCCRLRVAGGLDEVVVLSTCNRLEVYGTASAVRFELTSCWQILAPKLSKFHDNSYQYDGAEALAHLFAVTGGLDSMVLGETEISGQVKNAYEAARTAGATGRILNQAFQKALKTAKEIRTRTSIGRGATSVGSVAVEVADKIFGPALATQRVLILGAGQMAEACVRHLVKRGVKSLVVSNRSLERAQLLASSAGGKAVHLDDSAPALTEADIVIASTSCPHSIVTRAELEALLPARRHRPLFLIDIAVPRNIDPAVQQLDNVYLYNIDDLQAIVRQNVQHREKELASCREIICRNVAALLPRLVCSGSSVQRDRPRLRKPPGWAFSCPGALSPVLSAKG